MMDKSIAYIFLLFMLYSMIGYVCEVIYCSFLQKKFVNRGFLCGPYCPIYGVGSIFVLYAVLRFKEDPIAVFILGAIITSCLEYFTSFLLEKIFHNKWWDYSDEAFNINGRVCLQNALLFGLGSLGIIYALDPLFTKFLSLFSNTMINVLAIISFIIIATDFIYSAIVAYNLRNRIIICEELKSEKLAKIPGMLEKIMKERVEKFKLYPKRLLEAFPKLKNANAKEFDLMKKLRDKNKKKQKNKKKK